MGVLPATPPGRPPSRRPWGQTLSPTGLYGPDHQHFFVARMDMAVDGVRNRVVEASLEPAGTSTDDEEDKFARANGRHSAFRRNLRVLSSERDAAREASPQTARHWIVESTTRKNRVGEPTAWRLEPGAGSAITLACDPRASFLDRASFLTKAVWVSEYRPEERFPSGDYPNQRPPSNPDGLSHWTKTRDAPLAEGADIVLWHVFGVSHVVRTEDAPVMPCERVGFALKPCGFFDVSPCTDVPCSACERQKRHTELSSATASRQDPSTTRKPPTLSSKL
jgi:primary-amine oxidase